MSSCLSILIKTLNSDAVHLTILMTNYPTYNYVGCEIKNLTIKTYLNTFLTWFSVIYDNIELVSKKKNNLR